MTKTSTSSATLTRRYVTALLDAAENSSMTSLATSIRDLARTIDGSVELQQLLVSPLVSVSDQQRAVAAVLDAARCDKVLAGFVGVVLQNRRGDLLLRFLNEALAEIARRDGITQADVDVAAPLPAEQQKQLADMLGQWSGSRVTLNIRVTPEVLGGIRIRLGSIQIDDSIAGKLDRLKQTLLGHAQA